LHNLAAPAGEVRQRLVAGTLIEALGGGWTTANGKSNVN
jgi:hypothetical protein